MLLVLIIQSPIFIVRNRLRLQERQGIVMRDIKLDFLGHSCIRLVLVHIWLFVYRLKLLSLIYFVIVIDIYHWYNLLGDIIPSMHFKLQSILFILRLILVRWVTCVKVGVTFLWMMPSRWTNRILIWVFHLQELLVLELYHILFFLLRDLKSVLSFFFGDC